MGRTDIDELARARRDDEIEGRGPVEGYGRLAGLLLVAGALLSIPGKLLGEAASETYLLTGLVALTGLVCLAIPWDRLSPQWLHAVGAVATLEVGAAVAFVDQTYSFYFVIIAVLVAPASPRRLVLAAHLALIAAVVLVPIAWEAESARSIVSRALLLVPSVTLAAAIVVYLRERLEAKQRVYRDFAEEVLELTGKIRGTPVAMPIAEPGVGAATPHRRHPRAVTRLRLASLGASVALAVPLALASLAVAGVVIPGFAVESFEGVGITLPNQSTTESEDSVTIGAADREGHQPSVERLVSLQGVKGSGDGPGGGGAPVVEPGGGDGTAPAGAIPIDGGGSVQNTLDRALHDTTQHLDQVLSQGGLSLRIP